MPIIPEHYDRMDWLPCPDCWSEKEYELEQTVVLDSMGTIQKNTDGSLYIDPDWEPDLDDPQWGQGTTVDCERDAAGKIIARTFKGCTACGGEGECYKGPGDTIIGKSWHQWVIVEGQITEGTGKIPKDANAAA